MTTENKKDLCAKITFATQSQLNRFPNNSCKFRKFQTVVKHFLKLYGAQISF